MKKTLVSMLVAILVFAVIVACGGSSSSPVPPPAPTVPGAPTLGAVTAGNAQVTVNFTAPANNGGSAITGYEVTCNPGTKTATGATSPLTVTSLTNGTPYICSVVAINGVGTGASSANSAAVTPRAPMQVDGIAAKSVSDGTYLYVVTIKTVTDLQHLYLTKFNQTTGAVVWENPVLVTANFNEFGGIAIMGGYVYVLCVDDDPGLPGSKSGRVSIQKLDTATGLKIEIFDVTGIASPMGLISDNAANMLYVCFCAPSHLDWIVRIDTNGTTFGQTEDDPSGSIGQFSGLMAVDASGLFSVGFVMQSSARNRISVIKYAKDLSAQTWQVQYRNFADSIYPDIPTGVAPSNDDSSLYVGDNQDVSSANPRNIVLKVNTATGSIIETDLGQTSAQSSKEMSFDSLGKLYGILNNSVIKINVTTMAVTDLSISATYLTIDAANEKGYVSDGTDTVGYISLP